jgi:hypothetical protein
MFDKLKELLGGGAAMNAAKSIGRGVGIGARRPQPSRMDGIAGAVRGMQQAQPMGRVRTQEEKDAAPFRMFEDNSFQGDPSQFKVGNPNYRFYEDNSFSAPPQLQVTTGDSPQAGGRNIQGYNRYTPNSNLVQGNNYNPQNDVERFDIRRLLGF